MSLKAYLLAWSPQARTSGCDHNRLNLPVLGQADDLESFLFETSRQSLAIIGEGLRRVSNGQCLYCRVKVQEADVDHFVPFSLYPRDLTHNFVLTHPACNRSKSDALAGRQLLDRWLEHNTTNDDAIQEIGDAAGRNTDIAASRSVARWGYGNAVFSGSHAWVRTCVGSTAQTPVHIPTYFARRLAAPFAFFCFK